MEMVLWGLLIPFIGTTAGAASVFFLKKDLKAVVQRALTGFAAGVMVAASIWSLIVPAIEQSSGKGRLAFLQAFGLVFCFFFCWITSSRISTEASIGKIRLRGRKAD